MIFLRSQVQPFVALMQGGRTGSSYLMSALEQHSRVQALGEELIQYKDQAPEIQLGKAKLLLTPSLVGRHQAIGFKTKLTDITDLDQFRDLLEALNVRLLLCRRRNIVKLTLSWINFHRVRSAYGSHNLREPTSSLSPIQLDIDEFDVKLKQVEILSERFEIYCEQLALPKFSIYYEDFFSHEESTLEQIFHFLGVVPSPVQGKYKKVTPDNLKSAIVNFDEILAHYRGTHFEPMFTEMILSSGA